MRLALLALALVVLAAGGVTGMEAALDDAGPQTEITDEQFTPSAGTVQQLDESNRDGATYSESVSVADENGTQSVAGTDFVFFSQNGTIKPLTGGNLDGDSSATVSYSFREPTDTQVGFATTFSQIPAVLPLIGVVVVALAFIRALGG
jgi:hypothetical protein